MDDFPQEQKDKIVKAYTPFVSFYKEKKSSKKASKDEEDDDEIDVVDDPAEMNQLSQYINKWINPDSDPRFLF